MTNLDESASPKQSGNYHFIWRWHFYAGLFVAPFLIILALTGSLILFDDEIEGMIYRPLVQASPASVAVSPEQQEANVLRAFPGAKVQRYVFPSEKTRAAEFLISTKDRRNLYVFVDPHNGAINGSMDEASRFSRIVTNIHGELLIGRTGDLLVEFAGCWAFLLLLSGLFLWWPRKARKMGVVTPRLSAKGRGFWRDLHAVPSMWNAPVIAFLILSGLPWAGFWGDQLAKIGTLNAATLPTPNFVAPPQAPSAGASAQTLRTHVHDRDPVQGDLPWSVKKAEIPHNMSLHDHAHMRSIDLKFLVEQAAARNILAPGLRVLYPQSATGVFTLSFVPQTAQGQRTVHIDPTSGVVIDDIGWKQYSPLGKAVEFGVETHVGKQFGLANQLFMLMSCLLLITTISFGLVMWLKRRPPGRLGTPPAPANYKPKAVLLAIIVLCGAVFPLIGASMIVMWLFDAACVMKRAKA